MSRIAPEHGIGDRSLRYAAIIEDERVEAWQVEALERLDLERALPVACIQVSSHAAGTSSTASDRTARQRLWDTYERRRLQTAGRALGRQPLPSGLTDAPVIRCEFIRSRSGRWALPSASVRRLKAIGCDVALNFTGRSLDGVEWHGVTYGIWEHRIAIAHDAASKRPFTSATIPTLLELSLVRLGDAPPRDSALQRGWVHSVPHSMAATIDLTHRAPVDWIARTSREISHFGRPLAVGDQARPPARLRDTEMFRFVLGSPARKVQWALGRLVGRDTWHVGVVDEPLDVLYRRQSLGAPRWLANPSRRHYLADPFGVASSDTILVEAFDHLSHHGHIAAVDLNDEGPATAREVLRLGSHLSYPYLFEWEGEIFCVPESSQQRSAVLYRAARYPDRWEPITTLVEGLAVTDPTVVRHRDAWWLFCTDDDLGGGSNLHIFHADDLTGPWRPHLLNPVKIDARSARPGGTPFVADGALVRPAQDHAGGYGSAIVFNVVDDLSPHSFSERPVARLEPDGSGPYRFGLHTVASLGQRTLIDGKSKGPSLVSVVGRLRRGRPTATQPPRAATTPGRSG